MFAKITEFERVAKTDIINNVKNLWIVWQNKSVALYMDFEKQPNIKPQAVRKYVQDSVSAGLGKLPPQVPELEESVLGALMLEKDALTEVVDVLKPESFYVEKHKIIYNAIITLFTNSDPIDLLTVTNQLRASGELEMAGGAYYITQLTSKVNSAANIEYHARIVSEMSIKRELIAISSEILKDAYEETTDVFELLDKTEQSLFQVSESNIRKNYIDMSTVMRQAIDELEARKDHEDGLTGVPSGLTALDRVTNGWQSSDLIIIAARPGMGKTAFTLTSLRNAAVDHDIPVAFFSLEMGAVQLVNRLISAEAELESDKLRKGNLQEHEWQQLHHRIRKLSNAPIYMDDTPGLSILELRAKCRRLKAQHDIQIIVIDYLQLMSGDTGAKKAGNREQEIASISRALKGIAKELNVPVIALSQLSRAVESRGGNKRPQLSDLRESGSIEQDADQVMFLYRPEYYDIQEYEDGTPAAGTCEMIIAKNRHGSTDDVRMRFIGKFTKFCDLDFGGMDSFSGGMEDPLASFENSPSGGNIMMGSKMNDEGGNTPPPAGSNMDEDEVPF